MTRFIMPDQTRCGWVSDDPLYRRYHDQEWGRPCRQPRELFELLNLEGAQAGLSWLTILKKRQGYRRAFYDFDPAQCAAMSDTELDGLQTNPDIVRNRLKIYAVRQNARAWLELLQQNDDPVELLWEFVNGEPIRNRWSNVSEMPTATDQSTAMSRCLKKAGFTFVGPTICYAFMQAAGMVVDHTQECFLYQG